MQQQHQYVEKASNEKILFNIAQNREKNKSFGIDRGL